MVVADITNKIEVTGQILAVTNMQWNTFMAKKWRWMGNVVMTEQSVPVSSFIALNEKYLNIMLH